MSSPPRRSPKAIWCWSPATPGAPHCSRPPPRLGLAKVVKIGLLAKGIIALLFAGKKVIVGAAIAIGAAIKALLKKRKDAAV